MSQQRWTDVFNLLDGNRNGFIEKGDAARAAKMVGSGGHFSAAQIAQFQSAFQTLINGVIKDGDAGKDGKLNMAEWQAAAKKLVVGKSFEQAPAWWIEAATTMFNIVDVNKDGFLTESEYVKIIIGIVPSVTPEMAKAAFQPTNGKEDLPTFLKNNWGWVASPTPYPEDIMLALAVNHFKDVKI